MNTTFGFSAPSNTPLPSNPIKNKQRKFIIATQNVPPPPSLSSTIPQCHLTRFRFIPMPTHLLLLFTLLLTNLSAADPWSFLAPHSSPPSSLKLDPSPWRSPLLFEDGSPVQTPTDWPKRRSEILSTWHSLMGQWPPIITDPKPEILRSEPQPGFRRDRIRFQWTPLLHTEAWLLIPDNAKNAPGIITTYYEPDTAVGLSDKPDRDFALQLVKKGFVCLSIGTTESSADKTYAIHHPNIDHATVQPLSMLAYAAANAFHVLASRPEVDPARIGITGHSYGGKWAMFASCLYDKFACAAWSDAGIVFDDTRPSINYWEPWYLGSHPRPWRQRGLITTDNPARGLYPKLRAQGLDLHELHALMAPRPFLVSGGSEDPPARWSPLQNSIAVNDLLGHPNRVFMTNRPDHAPNSESNAVLVAFFEHFLKPSL